jgi:hypothetical protein
MVSRYPGEDAVLGSCEGENFAQLRLSSCQGFSPFPSSSEVVFCFEGTNRTLFLNLVIAELIVPARFFLHAQTEASFRHEKEVCFSLLMFRLIWLRDPWQQDCPSIKNSKGLAL